MKQILLVEDDHDIAALLRLNTEDEGYAITHEPDGERRYRFWKNSRGTR